MNFSTIFSTQIKHNVYLNLVIFNTGKYEAANENVVRAPWQTLTIL